MLVVRDIFYLKFGKAKEAKAAMKESIEIIRKFSDIPARILTDLTGRSYRLIFEANVKNLAELEDNLKSAFSNKEWEAWYQKFVPLVESSEREILSVVE